MEVSRHAALALALSLTAAAAAAPAQHIPAAALSQAQPAGEWKVEYADWKCVLHRELALDGKATSFSLTFEPLERVAWLRLATVEKGGRRTDGDAVMLVDGLRLPGTLHYNAYPAAGAGERRVREYMLDLKQQDLAAVKEKIRFWTRAEADVELQLAGFPAALRALTRCMAETLADLGVDLAEVNRMAVEPDGFSLDFVDHPRDRESFEYVLLYWVAADGHVDDCRLLQPSGVAGFDKSVCERLKAKARFKPARDSSGRPIRVPRFEHPIIRTQRF